MKYRRWLSLTVLLCLALETRAASDRFPVLARVPPAPKAALNTLLDWQRSLDGLSVKELQARLGAPDAVRPMARSAVTGKPVQMLIYRLSRRSEVQIAVHDGRTAAVTMLLLPSAHEDGPIDP